MTVALINGRVMLDASFGHGDAVLIEGGRILAIVPESEVPGGMARVDLGGGQLLPGFIDTQVNGGGGVLFNDDPTPAGIAAIGAAHRRFGTTGFLPTLISDSLEKISEAMEAVDQTIGEGVPGVLGIHVEGPFLNPSRSGIHDTAMIRTMDRAGIDLLCRRRRGRTLVTLAPELVRPEDIRELAQAEVIVAAGHTDADARTIFEALDHGLSGFTHLFNAMSPLGNREPGVVGAALFDDRSWCGIIVDGRHVDPVVLQIALRSTRASRFMLVTDAMPTVGAAETSFTLQGSRISVEDGVCVDENGTLAGSDLDMASAVRNAVRLLGLGLRDAVDMASRNPAAFLGLGHELGRIAPGYRADLVLVDESLNVIESWIGGEALAAEQARAYA